MLKMARARMLGPIDALSDVLERVQDVGLVHLTAAEESERLSLLALSPAQRRHLRMVKKAAQDAHEAITLLGGASPRTTQPSRETTLAKGALVAG